MRLFSRERCMLREQEEKKGEKGEQTRGKKRNAKVYIVFKDNSTCQYLKLRGYISIIIEFNVNFYKTKESMEYLLSRGN